MDTAIGSSATPVAPPADDDPLLGALDELVAAAQANMSAWSDMMSRVERIRELRANGVPYSEITLDDGTSPLIIDVLAANQERLSAAGSRYRRAAVRQLQADGLSKSEIARRMGVTRQRIANLLRGDTDAEHDAEHDDATEIDSEDER